MIVLRTLPWRTTQAFATACTVAQRAAFAKLVGASVGPLTEDALLLAGLPLSEGGCGVAHVDTVAPVARLAAVLQYLASAKRILGATPADLGAILEDDGGLPGGLLAAIGDRVPHTVEPLATWLAHKGITLPVGDPVRQAWWAREVGSQHKAAVEQRAAGRDIPRW